MSHDCLCGQHESQNPPAQDWIVDTIRDRGAGQYYRYGITGRNLNYPPCHPSHRFMWSVQNLDDDRYDVTEARHDGGLNGHASGSLHVDGEMTDACDLTSDL